jgi:hypothetical protein
VVVGVAAICASVFSLVLVPLVTTLVTAWWATLDARDAGERAPGRLGIVGLVLWSAVWALTAFVVLVFDAHFDCGGTFGGFGESASARLDVACRDRRTWRAIAGVLTVVAGAIAAGVMIRRRARRAASAGPGRRHQQWPGLVVAGWTFTWIAVIVALVVS